MADCLNCGKMDIGKNSLGMEQAFCSLPCKKEWYLENKNSFTTWLGDSPDVAEDRKYLKQIIEAAIEPACKGSKGARRWLKQKFRLRAVYDRSTQREVKL